MRTRIGRDINTASINLARKIECSPFAILVDRFTQQSFDTQQESRGDCRALCVALCPAQHHLGRSQCASQIVRRKPDAEVRSRHPQGAQDSGGEQRIVTRNAGPRPFVQPCANHLVSACHPRFEQAVDCDAGMPAIGWPDGNLLHRIAQDRVQVAQSHASASVARMSAQILDKAGQRAAILLRPDTLACERFGNGDEPVDRVRKRQFVIIASERGE